jgi:predicted murein hydrolase (TIGR00659 family)
MNPRFEDIWVYLSATPLLGLTVTLIAYQLAYWIYSRAKFHPLLNPVALSVAMLATLLTVTKTPYPTYFSGAQFIHFLLGPATVALAIPLYGQFARLKAEWRQLVIALVAGSLTATVSAVAIAWALGAKKATLLSLAPKSVTTPIAMGIAEKIGGLPSLTAVLVVSTGIVGAVLAKYVLDALSIADHAVRGFAVGVAAHGIGTARAFQVSEEAGAFAGLAMGLNGAVTALMVPLALWVLQRFG